MTDVRTRLGILCLALALGASACTGSGTDDTQHDTPPQPEWRTIQIDDSALPSEPYVVVNGALGHTGDVPAIMFGTIAEPDEPARAVVWHPGVDGIGESIPLDIDATETHAVAAGQVGDTTYLVGAAWDDGRIESALLASTDRRAWTRVEVPAGLADRDVMLQAVIDAGAGRAVAVGNSRQEIVAVDLDSGRTTSLPTPGKDLSDLEVTAVSDRAGRVVALAHARTASSTWTTVPLVSVDGARSWQVGDPLPGANAGAYGVVAGAGRLVATGEHTVGADLRAAAWSSVDGLTWRADQVPDDAAHGSYTSLSAPATVGGVVHAVVADSNALAATVVRRTARGQWRPVMDLDAGWRYPGTPTVLAADGTDLLTARSEDGRVQIGRVDNQPRVRSFRTTAPPPSVAPVAWWRSARVDGDRLVLVGAHTAMEVDGPHWRRNTRAATYVVERNRLLSGTWDPPGVEDLENHETATAPDGSQVIIGDQWYDDREGRLKSRLVGWHKEPGGHWEPVRGLTGHRALQVDSVRYLADGAGRGEWVLTAADSVDLSGGHEFGTVWTSDDGTAWRRNHGPFDRGDGRDTRLDDTCRLPDGDLLAVGERQVGPHARPLAFRRTTQGTWRSVDLTGLGKGADGLQSCTTIDAVTLLEGWEHTVALWRTSDGTSFERFTIGNDEDHVGTIVAVDGGFAAPGYRLDGGASQPVVWLSADGRRWQPVPAPVTRSMAVGQVVPWEDRLALTLTSDSGPRVQVLDNLDELLEHL